MAKGDRWTLPWGGRELYLDGKHVVTLTKKDFGPSEADALGHFLVDLLNDAEDDGDTFEEFFEGYMKPDDDKDDDELDEENE